MSYSIKFNHSPTNEVELNLGKASFSSLFAIGALTATSETIYPNTEQFYTIYQADKDGLKTIALQTSELLSSLHDATSVLGTLLANADISAVQNDISSIGWLMTGLSDLAEMVAVSHSDMRQSLSVYDEIEKMNDMKSIAS